MKYENMTSAAAAIRLRQRLLRIAEQRKKKNEEPTAEQTEALEAKMEKRNRKTFMERFGMSRKQVRKLMVWAPQRSGRQNLLENRIVTLRKQAENGGAPAQYPQSKSQKKRARVRAQKHGVKTRKAVKA